MLTALFNLLLITGCLDDEANCPGIDAEVDRPADAAAQCVLYCKMAEQSGCLTIRDRHSGCTMRHSPAQHPCPIPFLPWCTFGFDAFYECYGCSRINRMHYQTKCPRCGGTVVDGIQEHGTPPARIILLSRP